MISMIHQLAFFVKDMNDFNDTSIDIFVKDMDDALVFYECPFGDLVFYIPFNLV